MLTVTPPTIGVFASDRGPGDAERAALMAQVGNFIARKGARLVCIAERGLVPTALIAAARTAGAEVIVLTDERTTLPSAIGGLTVERVAGADARIERMAQLVTLFIGLPGSLGSVTLLYRSWVRAGGGAGRKPVILFNRNGAFEVVRGFFADVVNHSVKRTDRFVQFTDNVDDMWNRVTWLIEQGHAVGPAA